MKMRTKVEAEASMRSWDQYFMTMAYLVAMRSKDERTKIGAVIVNTHRAIVSTGYNGLPRGVEDLPERYERSEKEHWAEHAERNAVYNAALIGVSTASCTMYTQGIPCDPCANGVIQSGLYRLVVHKHWMDLEPDKDRYSRSRIKFREKGICLSVYDGPLLGIRPVLDDIHVNLEVE